MNRIAHIKRHICLFSINHFFSGNHFWRIKRSLMRAAGAVIGKNTKIVGPIYFTCKLTIGDNCWIGMRFSAHGNGSVSIGDYCDFAPEVTLLTGSHEIGRCSHRAGKGIALPIEIGNGCWIGARATILGNSNIKDGCVVGSCTLTNKVYEKNSLIVGVPGVCKKYLTE